MDRLGERFQVLCITAFTTVLQAIQNHSVDVFLSVPLIAGGVVGAQFGVEFSERLKAEQLRALLALLVLAVAVRMALGLVVPPEFPYTLSTRARLHHHWELFADV